VRPPPSPVAGLEQGVELVLAEAQQVQVEAIGIEAGELAGEHLLVPAGVEGQLVVRDDQGAALGVGEVVEHDDGHRVHIQLPSRHEPPVAGDDRPLAVDEDGVCPAELANAGGDLRHLLLAVGARVCGVGNEVIQLALLDDRCLGARHLCPPARGSRFC
jgi:hypothetical protein